MSNDINMAIGDRPDLRWVALDRIMVDHNYQREVKPNLVAKILRKFEWKKFGCVCLVEHDDGRFSVYEGQHRVSAARAHPKIDTVPAAIVRLDSLVAEADAFLGMNVDRVAVTPVERYWAGLTAGDPVLRRVRDVLARAGCEVVPTSGGSTGSHMTNSVAAVQRAIERYGEAAVAQACRTLKDAWAGDKGAQSGTLINALARIYRGNPDLMMDRMVQMLRQKPRAQLAADAEAMRKISGGAAETNLTRTLVAIYNKGLSKNTISIGVAA